MTRSLLALSLVLLAPACASNSPAESPSQASAPAQDKAAEAEAPAAEPSAEAKAPEAPAEAKLSCAEPVTELTIIDPEAGVPEVDAQWVASHACDNVVLVDVRNDDEVAQGMIEGAKHIPLPELEARLSELDPKAPTVFVCRSGGRSGRATKLAREKGFERAGSLQGGMIHWGEEGLPATKP